MIHQFDGYNTLTEIRNNYKKIEYVANSLADNATEYRKFYNTIKLDFSISKEVIHKAEYSLLIECYTFAERLLKNTIYHCLEYNNSDNKYINRFLEKKIPPGNFSPQVTFKKFEEELCSYEKDFKFILNKNHPFVKVYDEMIKARHQYAHRNYYNQSYQEYSESIEILEYILWECEMFINDLRLRDNLVKDFTVIISNCKAIKRNKIEASRIKNLKIDEFNLADLKKSAKNLKNLKHKHFHDLNIFKDFNSFLDELIIIDFRKETLKDFKIKLRKIDDYFR
ncbi:hypothetical protein [Macrococcus equipercicus]|uniref:Uncharacterized protein n=1 Tax=Macrococcus equipercicus TaxID=69967 RepID=A0A9Q9F1W9_9STAP|nr:hypothetical protein [Macrococcus equipercicus]UTH14200.1 hypothetical protein KFV11_02215 [Macrococcus equipercicus]